MVDVTSIGASRKAEKRETTVRFSTNLLSLLLSAWFLMLAMGRFAHQFGWPPFSYLDSLIAVVVLGSVVQYGTNAIHGYVKKSAR